VPDAPIAEEREMDPTTAANTTPRDAACPACGGPVTHPGLCVDQDGYILPVYGELAQAWQEQGYPPMLAGEIEDFLETYHRDEVQRA
jgi:hypothetical protein